MRTALINPELNVLHTRPAVQAAVFGSGSVGPRHELLAGRLGGAKTNMLVFNVPTSLARSLDPVFHLVVGGLLSVGPVVLCACLGNARFGVRV